MLDSFNMKITTFVFDLAYLLLFYHSDENNKERQVLYYLTNPHSKFGCRSLVV